MRGAGRPLDCAHAAAAALIAASINTCVRRRRAWRHSASLVPFPVHRYRYRYRCSCRQYVAGAVWQAEHAHARVRGEGGQPASKTARLTCVSACVAAEALASNAAEPGSLPVGAVVSSNATLSAWAKSGHHRDGRGDGQGGRVSEACLGVGEVVRGR